MLVTNLVDAFDHVVSLLPRCQVLVVGDVMLDRYLTYGGTPRQSPEDRVSDELRAQILDVTTDAPDHYPGGAANAATNASKLGVHCTLIGVTGSRSNKYTERLHKELWRVRESCDGRLDSILIEDGTRVTTRKDRYVQRDEAGRDKHGIRLDYEDRREISAAIEDSILEAARSWIKSSSRHGSCRSCVISDYGKGVITRSLSEEIIRMMRTARIAVVVDPKGKDYKKYSGATIVVPNQDEALIAAGRQAKDPWHEDVALQISNGASAVIVTRGRIGMEVHLRTQSYKCTRIPSYRVDNPDVTGASDAVVAVLAATLGAGASILDASHFANAGAAWSVGGKRLFPVSIDGISGWLREERFQEPPRDVVLISHSTKDQVLVERVASLIKANGYDCFVASRSIRGGTQDWLGELRRAMSQAKVGVLLLTKRGFSSQWVMAEAGALWALGKPIIPVCLDRLQRDLPSFISHAQAIWISEEEFLAESAISERVLSALHNELRVNSL